jgi:hypothetical protein
LCPDAEGVSRLNARFVSLSAEAREVGIFKASNLRDRDRVPPVNLASSGSCGRLRGMPSDGESPDSALACAVLASRDSLRVSVAFEATGASTSAKVPGAVSLEA